MKSVPESVAADGKSAETAVEENATFSNFSRAVHGSLQARAENRVKTVPKTVAPVGKSVKTVVEESRIIHLE